MSALGIDIGATHARYGVLVNDRVEQTASAASRVTTPEELASQCKEIIESFEGVASVGIAVPGFLDKSGIVYSPPNFPGWGTVNMKELLEKTIGRSVVLDRDSVAALYGEWKLGAAKGAKNVVLLTIGTGIGGAAVVDGKILRGHHGFSGEFGHAIIGPAGRKCGLGHDGCAEAWASGRAMEQGVSLDQATAVFARLLRSLELIFDPELFVLSGGLLERQEYIDQSVGKAKSIGLQTDVKIAKLGEWAGVAGAALLAAEQA